MDDDLRAALEQRTGEPVVHFAPAVGGSGGVTGIVRSTNDRYFVKAVPLSSPWIDDCRTEAAIRSPHSPRLRWSAECAGFFVLVFDVAPGQEPDEPWRERDLQRVLAATDHLDATAGSLTLPTVADRMRGRCTTWQDLTVRGVRDRLTTHHLSGWERRNLKRLAELEAEWEGLVVGDHLLHFDLRHDNLRLTDDGGVRVLDWGRACLGPDWVDPVCLLLESSIGLLDAEKLFLQSSRGQAADPVAVDAFLVALASYWRHAGSQPAGATTRRMRARQVRSGEATVKWSRSRWG
jgi:hypothetical protein